MRQNRRLILLLGLAAAGAAYLLTPFRLGIVIGESMAPSLQSGEPYVLVRSLFAQRPVRRGDVVVFKHRGATYIKRVMATEGEGIWVVRQKDSRDEELVMDWQLEKLQKVLRTPLGRSLKLIRRRVPPGTCYVVGDHLMMSSDSRHYGPIQLDHIQGTLLFAPPAPFRFQHVAAVTSAIGRS
jgi:signal peptidase I